MLEIKEDIRDECAILGEVTNVVLFDKEPDGVASIRFADAEAAKECVKVHFLHFIKSLLTLNPSLCAICSRNNTQFSSIPPPSPSQPQDH